MGEIFLTYFQGREWLIFPTPVTFDKKWYFNIHEKMQILPFPDSQTSVQVIMTSCVLFMWHHSPWHHSPGPKTRYHTLCDGREISHAKCMFIIYFIQIQCDLLIDPPGYNSVFLWHSSINVTLLPSGGTCVFHNDNHHKWCQVKYLDTLISFR